PLATAASMSPMRASFLAASVLAASVVAASFVVACLRSFIAVLPAVSFGPARRPMGGGVRHMVAAKHSVLAIRLPSGSTVRLSGPALLSFFRQALNHDNAILCTTRTFVLTSAFFGLQ